MQSNDDEASDDGRSKERDLHHHVKEANHDGYGNRACPTQKLPAMTREGVDGSLRDKGYKHLLHCNECDRGRERESRSRSRILVVHYVRAIRRRRSRGESVRDYRGAGTRTGMPRSRSRSPCVDARRRQQPRKSRSSSVSPRRYGRMERKSHYAASSSSGDDYDYRVTSKRKSLHSRPPSVNRVRHSRKYRAESRLR
ncbi:uncharacterized protein LOC125230343 [Leguminivora glycinivorella]|uniref:uncharacterized protein LOC125230343 n=1 Tax=Leguminivora glycinivorella TaxID=1035111 RepID=UPI00200E8D90|nr:uncharacterized protein LOC125230343 [Leguminivora glycinivorella]XP_047991434.1 uncharacterized protein LOC125230343 [Leguminivora glycinivorella]